MKAKNILAALAFSAELLVPNAHAAAMLEILSGANLTTVLDNGAGDSDNTLGSIVFVATPLDNDWIAVQVTATSLGTASQPDMKFDVSAYSDTTGSLTVRLTDSGFVGPMSSGNAGPFYVDVYGYEIAGTGSATRQMSFIGLGDSTTFVNLVGPYDAAGGGFTAIGSGSFPTSAPFNLGVQAALYHGGAAGTAFGAHLVAAQVAEPATLALFGLGLAGLGAMRRKKLAA